MEISKTPTVFVVTADGSIRDALGRLCRAAGWTVEAHESAEAFLSVFAPACHGCLVVDAQLPGMSGFELQQELAARSILTPVIFLGDMNDVDSAVRAMRNHAFDYLIKPSDPQSVVDHIRLAIREDATLRENDTQRTNAAARIASLTSREREILELIVAGASNKRIAAQLRLSEKTVEFHRAKVKRKMGAESTAELVCMSVLVGAHTRSKISRATPHQTTPESSTAADTPS